MTRQKRQQDGAEILMAVIYRTIREGRRQTTEGGRISMDCTSVEAKATDIEGRSSFCWPSGEEIGLNWQNRGVTEKMAKVVSIHNDKTEAT